MKMPAKKHTAVMLAAALALAACGEAEKPVADAAPSHIVQVAAVDDLDAQLPSVVEQRHFAIYNTYRVLSDDSSDLLKSTAAGRDEEGLHAVAALSTCSIHSLPPQD